MIKIASCLFFVTLLNWRIFSLTMSDCVFNFHRKLQRNVERFKDASDKRPHLF